VNTRQIGWAKKKLGTKAATESETRNWKDKDIIREHWQLQNEKENTKIETKRRGSRSKRHD